MGRNTVYIDEAGDLGYGRGTKWFVLSAVIVDKENENSLRQTIKTIKTKLNIEEIHFRKITDFYRRGYLVKEISKENFTYINIITDTNKLDRSKIGTPIIAYNYICRMLLERVSWFLRDNNNTADIVLSARGTSRDGELIKYIEQKLIPYSRNRIASGAFEKIKAKTSNSWDLLQLADVCATTTFLAYEVNSWGFCTPCYFNVLKKHLYERKGKIASYGIKYFTDDMIPTSQDMANNYPCR